MELRTVRPRALVSWARWPHLCPSEGHVPCATPRQHAAVNEEKASRQEPEDSAQRRLASQGGVPPLLEAAPPDLRVSRVPQPKSPTDSFNRPAVGWVPLEHKHPEGSQGPQA